MIDRSARHAYHALVHSAGFAEWFARVTPLEELAALQIGSRPARRGLSVSGLDDLRAIPWVFAWAQTRVNMPGWYGLGSGLAAVGDVDRLRRAYANWPLFTVLLENAEMSLATTDRRIAERYLELGNRPELTALVLDEHARTVEWVLAVTGHDRLLEDRPVVARAVALRNPYVDALSHLQLRALRALRAGGSDTTWNACVGCSYSPSTAWPRVCRIPAEPSTRAVASQLMTPPRGSSTDDNATEGHNSAACGPATASAVPVQR